MSVRPKSWKLVENTPTIWRFPEMSRVAALRTCPMPKVAMKQLTLQSHDDEARHQADEAAGGDSDGGGDDDGQLGVALEPADDHERQGEVGADRQVERTGGERDQHRQGDDTR